MHFVRTNGITILPKYAFEIFGAYVAYKFGVKKEFATKALK